ncbi:MAG: class I SAM-dependent methyltransferase [candidate division WOR-3 bacterium]|nr:MAG: class I SAM-dependent methyltransferase [candidate division WOR-3 bacterium]
MLVNDDLRYVVKTTARTYDTIAPEYCRKTRQQRFLDWERGYIERLFFSIRQPAPRLLDVGCGDGRHCRIIEELGGSAIGIDRSRKMIAEARTYYARGHYVIMDMCALAFRSAWFDGIWASGSIYHVPKSTVGQVVQGFKRIVKRHGVIAVSFKLGSGEGLEENPRSYRGSPRFFAYYTKNEMEDVFSRAGFSTIASCAYPEDVYGDGIQQMWFGR